MLHLDLTQLNCMVSLTSPLMENNHFEKYYIYTNSQGLEYFDEKMKIDNAALYDQVFLEQFLEGVLYYLNKNSRPVFVPYGETFDEEVIKSEHKKMVMGFKCDNWETAQINFNRERIIDLLNEQKVSVNLNELSDIEIFAYLQNYVINLFNSNFHSDNVFVTVISQEEDQELRKGNSNNFIFYLERLNLYNKLQTLEVSHNIIKIKNKI